MKKIVLDTNVLISFLTDRNPAQQEKAAKLFVHAASLSVEILCPGEVLSEFVYVMDSVYRVGKSDIRDMLRDFIDMPGVTMVSIQDQDLVFQLWPEHISDYGDAVVASLCKKTRQSTVATFDRKFSQELIATGLAVIEDW